MAAPINWNVNKNRNSENSFEMGRHVTQNQMFNIQRHHRDPANRFPPRLQQQQQPVQTFNPRFPPPLAPGSLPVERPNFSPNSTMVPNRFQARTMQQNEQFFNQNVRMSFQGEGEPQPFGQTRIPPMGYEHQNTSKFQLNQTFNQPSVENKGPNHFQPLNKDNFSNDMNTTYLHNSLQNIHEPGIHAQPTHLQLKTEKERQDREDQQWLRNWLHRKSAKIEDNTTEKTMKIFEAQEKTRHMMVLLARLQKNKQILQTLICEDKSIWDQKLKEVLSIKTELENVQKELTSEDNVRHLKAKVVQRKKKKERLRQRKEDMYRQHEEELANIERKNAEIDKAMQQLVEKQKLEKQEKDMQKEADEILSQVRKKLSEANKSIQVVNNLQKLRKLRTDRLERQGVLHMYESQGHSSTNRLMFEAKLSNVTELLNKQLEIYRAEEAALKVHLETEQEETREKEREKARLRMIEKQKRERKKEEKMLFGDQKDPVHGDPLYPFRQYYDSAGHSLDALVAIRREWDAYLTSPKVGSCIPDDWVLPNVPASDVWATALEGGQPT